MRKEVSVSDMRKVLQRAICKLRQMSGMNITTDRYLHKLEYELGWLQNIPATKAAIDGWRIRDYTDMWWSKRGGAE